LILYLEKKSPWEVVDAIPSILIKKKTYSTSDHLLMTVIDEETGVFETS